MTTIYAVNKGNHNKFVILKSANIAYTWHILV